MHRQRNTIAMQQQLRAAQRALLPARHSAFPSWDVLLTVASLAAEGRRECISTIANRAGVPFSSAQKCIAVLEGAGLVQRSADPLNARRVFVTLSQQGQTNLEALFSPRPYTKH